MKIAVICGGPSPEAEVSRVSARAVEAGLNRRGHAIRLYELGPELGTQLHADEPDVVFPVTHGLLGEDGCLQGLLEVLGFPYVGSGVRASAIAADKITTKQLYRSAGIPVARDLELDRSVLARAPEELLPQLRDTLGQRFVVKPAEGGSTIGMSRMFEQHGPGDLAQALSTAFAYSPAVLLEEYVLGTELTCGVLEDEQGPHALPPTQISAVATEWYDFQSKYAPGGSQHQCPAPLSPELTSKIQRTAELAHRVLGNRDLSRTDFILREDGSFVVLETNTLPGMTDVSLFPEAAQAGGIPFDELVDRLAQRAHARRGVRNFTVPKIPGR